MVRRDQRTSSELHGLQRREPFAAASRGAAFPRRRRASRLPSTIPTRPRAVVLALARVNIPADVNELATGAGSEGSDDLPNGVLQLRNDAGTWATSVPRHRPVTRASLRAYRSRPRRRAPRRRGELLGGDRRLQPSLPRDRPRSDSADLWFVIAGSERGRCSVDARLRHRSSRRVCAELVVPPLL